MPLPVRRRTAALAAGLVLTVTAACAGDPERDPGAAGEVPGTSPNNSPSNSPSASPVTPPPSGPSPSAPTALEPGTVPPSWLGTRVLPRTASGFGEVRPTPVELRNRRFTLPDTLPALPGTGFASDVVAPAPAEVLARSTWSSGCPVAAADLAWVRVTFRGFDESRHTGELLVHRTVARPLVRVFGRLWEADFPLEQLRITTRAERDAAPTGDGNGTGAFVCRPVRGGSEFSQHAYGLALDLNPFQNPYVKDDVVLPELASAYADRSRLRPGMVTADGPVVRAFASIGWEWGGAWRTLKDYQHFSATGR